MTSIFPARFHVPIRTEMLRAALGTGAFLLGLLGEVLLFRERWRTLGVLAIALAALLSALAWRGARETFSPNVGSTEWGAAREKALRIGGIAGALLLFVGSLMAWRADPGAIFGLQGVLWMVSMALLIASCWRWGARRVAVEERWTQAEIAIFAGIVILSLFTHLAWLNDIPWRFNADENTAYIEAMRFYRGPAISLFTTTWYGTGMPSMPLAISGWLLNITGISLGGVRTSTALFGALTVVPLYGLGRLLYGPLFAALAAFFMAVSTSGIDYSRVSLPNMLTPFAWTICFYFLLRGLKSSHPVDFSCAGLAAGLSMYTYYAARLLPYLLIAYVIYLALFHRAVFKAHLGHFAITLAGFFVGFGPLLAYFVNNPSVWTGRGIAEMVIPAEIPANWDALVADVQTVVPLIWRNFLGLSVITSRDHIYWGTFLLPVEAVLALIGTGVLIWRWRQPGSFLVLLWGAVTLFIAGPLIAESVMPAYVHWTPAFPAIYLAVALPPALWLRSLTPARGWQVAGRAVLAAGAAAIAGANGYYYLVLYPPTMPPAFESAQGRFLATLEARDRVYFVGNSWISYSPATHDMLAPHVTASELLNPSRELPLPADPDHNLVFVFNEDEVRYLPLIKGLYHGGVSGRIDTPGGPIGGTYECGMGNSECRMGAGFTPHSDSGLLVRWQGSGGPESRVDMFIGSSMLTEERSPTFEPFLRPAPERDPNFAPLMPTKARDISWSGEIYAEGGLYTMNLRTDGHCELVIDGQVVVDLSHNQPVAMLDFYRSRFLGTDAQVNLAKGWHTVRISLDPTGNFNGMEWSWTPPGDVQQIVPPWVLRH